MLNWWPAAGALCSELCGIVVPNGACKNCLKPALLARASERRLLEPTGG